MTRLRTTLLLLPLAALFACASPPNADEALLRVATFNLRYGTAKERDARDNWPNRRENVLATIAALDVDVLGVQEALHLQVEYLREHLPRYQFVGQGRDGGEKGEYAAVLFDSTRFELVQSGDFWLSETPDVVASVGWDAALTRMCTWVQLRDRATSRTFRVWNTHFDHRGLEARTNSGALLGERVAASPLPDLVLGDLNSGEATAALTHLRDSGLADTFRDAQPDAVAVGTFGAWVGKADGDKIDYVLRDGGFATVSAAIDRRAFDGRNPSDHFPVTATVRFVDG